MNTQEETLWLSELTDDFLKEACIWPSNMMKLVHVTGILTTLLLVFGSINLQVWTFTGSISALILIVYKGYVYNKDICLIRYELQRRQNRKVR
ncbi:hypothetical protein [Colwellia piezophila]|uniref:hypothetical protein n=1 Tax=Colwellia piezophila TaxID=211668 RepID=UPI000371FC7B|nr:hypothetical protein [Colwellia piezophila]